MPRAQNGTLTNTLHVVSTSITVRPCEHGWFKPHPIPGGACFGAYYGPTPPPEKPERAR